MFLRLVNPKQMRKKGDSCVIVLDNFNVCEKSVHKDRESGIRLRQGFEIVVPMILPGKVILDLDFSDARFMPVLVSIR